MNRLKGLAPDSHKELARCAIVQGSHSLEKIERFLPSNYGCYIDEHDRIIISGTDYCGWTMDEYVLPRLGSGGIVALEVLTDGNFVPEHDGFADVGCCEACGAHVYHDSGRRFGDVYHFVCWQAVTS